MVRKSPPDVTLAPTPPPPVVEVELHASVRDLFHHFAHVHGPQALAYYLQLRVAELNTLALVDDQYDLALARLAGVYQALFIEVCAEVDRG